MIEPQDIQLEEIRRQAEQEAARFIGEWARAVSQEKEELLAALELERWLAQSCADCLEGPRALR